MIFKLLQADYDVDDGRFNDLYPDEIKELAQRHWTPVDVAKIASQYLVEWPEDRVLDIGSGVGKFCLVGASCTKGKFYGVEQRESLVQISKDLAVKYNVQNVEFIHGNMEQILFSEYDAFYFYNSFYENLDTFCPIDDLVTPDKDLYYSYTNHLRNELDKAPVGTRLVSYWSGWDEIPPSFNLEHTAYEGFLNFWRKEA
ncbi:class I SAM-dependent methyltransferase [Sphingobacterium tabacisoli]|uniref:Class I SAM-dependent methyltransferase n=1 Tax=Sphingobacterium tabacisoli TaxID=2044855 RepID=A0ABW5L963_9SPHI|nr:class I SAM-dependent methyltransferase [Sphingobacterium tabacisoli]